MLSFEKTSDRYRITETRMTWTKDKVSTVDYKFDLSENRCDKDPWKPTTESDRQWFIKYYLPHFTH